KALINIGLIKVPLKSSIIIIIHRETELHWQWPMQFCYLETFFTAPFFFKVYLRFSPYTLTIPSSVLLNFFIFLY
ncbi:MAG: hypothetical protein K6G64_04325, partial [Eubacterium sp.]|nr:hypothetical protein [Eubacterium sp.]